MLRTVFVATSLSVLLCCASADSLRDQLATSDKAIDGFMIKKDAAGFRRYMKGIVTKNFKYVENSRVETCDQMCAGIAKGFSQMKKITKADVVILSLNERGNTAVGAMLHTLVGISEGRDHKTHVITFKGSSSDTYVKEGGKWKMSQMMWGRQHMLLDGKPVKMSRGG